jgi:hypothetical protein
VFRAERVVLIEGLDSEIDLIEAESINIEELNALEFDRDTIRNIREKAALIMDLISSSDQVLRTSDPRLHEREGFAKTLNVLSGL